jgi:PEGA domain
VPSPKIHFNFGLAFEGLARRADALEAFQRFLDEAKDAAPERREEARAHVLRLREQVATVTIVCDTDGAAVTLDGRAVGTTPLVNGLYADAGPHQLAVSAAGGLPVVQDFTARPGVESKVIFRTRPVAPSLAAAAPASSPPAAGPASAPVVLSSSTPAAEPPSRRRPLMWAAIAAAVVAGGIAVALVAGSSTNYPRVDAQIRGN